MLRTSRELTQMEFGKIAGVSDVTVSYWERGSKEPRLRSIIRICNYFHINPNAFIDPKSDVYDSDIPRGASPVPQTRKVPLVGQIACGDPILAVEEAEETVDMPDFVHADFALKCKGDSMINARIFDGDTVYIRKQNTINDGEIAAVLIDDEATLKRVYVFSDHVILQPENPKYKPLVFYEEDAKRVHILGKAVAFTSEIR